MIICMCVSVSMCLVRLALIRSWDGSKKAYARFQRLNCAPLPSFRSSLLISLSSCFLSLSHYQNSILRAFSDSQGCDSLWVTEESGPSNNDDEFDDLGFRLVGPIHYWGGSDPEYTIRLCQLASLGGKISYKQTNKITKIKKFAIFSLFSVGKKEKRKFFLVVWKFWVATVNFLIIDWEIQVCNFFFS